MKLHERFDEICEKVREINKPPGDKKKAISVSWKIPYVIIAFIANEIKSVSDERI